MPSASALKWVSLVVILFQNAATPIFFRFAMTSASSEDRFDTGVAVTTSEVLKFLMSVLLLLGEQGGSLSRLTDVVRRDIVEKPNETLKLGVPALLYFVQNMCLQFASANLPAAVFQVTYQGKTLVVAFCSVLLLSKKLTREKWLAIAIMGSGLAVVQLAKSTEGKQGSMANASEQSLLLGLFFTLVGCLCSGFAGVYFEKMMKNPSNEGGGAQRNPSMWLRNIQLAGFSILIGVAQLTAAALFGSSSVDINEPLHGFTTKVWLMVFNNAIGGLCVAFVIKYADNILKGFACALATVLATLASVPLFGFSLRPLFVVGMCVVLASTFLYGGTLKLGGDWWNSEPELCASMRGRSSSGART